MTVIDGTLFDFKARPGQSIKLPHEMNHAARADMYDDCM